MGWLSNLWKKLKPSVDDVVDAVSEAAKVAAEYLLRNSGAILVEAARAAVDMAEQTGGAGEDKKKMAFNLAKNILKERGAEVASSAINLAIEVAVARLKLKA